MSIDFSCAFFSSTCLEDFDDLREERLEEMDFFCFSFFAVLSLWIPFWSAFEFGLFTRSESDLSWFLLDV